MIISNSVVVYSHYSTDDIPVYSFGWLDLATATACHLT